MVFLISLTLIENLDDKIKIFTPLTMNNFTTWGQIPGSYGYSYQKNVTLFSITDINPDTLKISMTSEGPFSFNVSRELVNPVYDDAKKVINYTMSHTYSQNAPQKRLKDKQVQQLNLDGMAIWY